MPKLSRVKGRKAAMGTQTGSAPRADQGSGGALNETLAGNTCHKSYCGDNAGGGGPSKMGSWILCCAEREAGHM